MGNHSGVQTDWFLPHLHHGDGSLKAGRPPSSSDSREGKTGVSWASGSETGCPPPLAVKTRVSRNPDWPCPRRLRVQPNVHPPDTDLKEPKISVILLPFFIGAETVNGPNYFGINSTNRLHKTGSSMACCGYMLESFSALLFAVRFQQGAGSIPEVLFSALYDSITQFSTACLSNPAPLRRRSIRLEYVACESDSNSDLIVPSEALCGGLSFCVTSREMKCIANKQLVLHCASNGHTHSQRSVAWYLRYSLFVFLINSQAFF